MPEEAINYIIPEDVLRSIRGRLATRRGERCELLCLKKLRENGWSAARSRKGVVDVFAAKNGNVLLVQVKSGMARVSKRELDNLKKYAEDFNASAEIWYFRGKNKLRRHSVTHHLPALTKGLLMASNQQPQDQ